MMSDLLSQFTYTQQQLTEANHILDTEWEEHVGNLKKSVRGERPARETVYRVLSNNRNILDQQRRTVTEMMDRLKEQRLANITTGWRSLDIGGGMREEEAAADEIELEKLAESLKEKSKITPVKEKPPKPAV